MTEQDAPIAEPAPGGETGAGPAEDASVGPGAAYPGTPGWVKVSGIIVLGLVVLLVVALVVATALGLHTPGGPGGHGG